MFDFYPGLPHVYAKSSLFVVLFILIHTHVCEGNFLFVSGCHAENMNPDLCTDFLLYLPTQEDS